jgi:putative aldouronate transport system permease protein
VQNGGIKNMSLNFAPNEKKQVRIDQNQTLWKRMWKAKTMYLFILPTLVYFLIFSYIPYYGLTIAFKDFKIFLGIEASPWVGFKYFNEFFNSPDFGRLLKNTVLISLYRITFGFPIPILFALLLNEVRHSLFKRVIQTVTYFPNFLSWVVYGGIILTFIQPTGIVNTFAQALGYPSIDILTSTKYFVPMLIITDIMKNFGFGAIIYLASLSNIDHQLYEAAIVDGARKLKQIWHITLPGIRPTIIVMLVLSLGNVMNAGFDQIFNLYNASVYEVTDIIDTFVYRIGLQGAQYSVGTAVGMFKGVIGFVLIFASNSMIRRTGEYSIW